MKVIRTLVLSMVLLQGMLVPVLAQSAILSTPPASDVKLRSVMTSQFQALETRLANGKAMLQAIIVCHEGTTKQFYVQRNATAVPRCFDPVSGLLTLPVVTPPVVTPPVVALPVVNVQPCPAGWETLPGFGSNANHCWWSQYENPRCVGVDMQMIGVGYVFDRSSGTPTRTEDPGKMWTSESNSPSCGG